jgi:CAAX protease family protein
MGGRVSEEWVPWTWLDLLRAVAFVLLLVGACALLLGGGYFALRAAEHHHLLAQGWLRRELRPLRPYRVGLLALALTVVLYGAAFLGIRRYTIVKYRLRWSALYLQHATWHRYLNMVALYIPMQLGSALVVAAQTRLAGHTIQNPQQGVFTHAAQHHWLSFAGLFVAAAVIAPIVEELAFRGFFYRLLRKRLPVWAAVPISAAVFAVGHGLPVLIPVLFFLGVVLALVVERTRSLYCSMILHALQNTFALVALYHGGKGL